MRPEKFVYIQNLCTINPTSADLASLKHAYPNLEDVNVSGTMTAQIERMLRNIDTLSGPGASRTLLDGAGVSAGGIAGLSADARTRLCEKVTNRYMSAIKEAVGDTLGSFADVYGNVLGGPAGAGPENVPTVPGTDSASGSQADINAPVQVAPVDAGALADILMRSVAFRPGGPVSPTAPRGTGTAPGPGAGAAPESATHGGV